jgi:DNA-binding XRE family transcriptional regulator
LTLHKLSLNVPHMQLNTKAVKRLRWESGDSQKALAKKAGISSVTLLHLEQGRTKARVSTVKKIADALGVKVADITTTDDDAAVA